MNKKNSEHKWSLAPGSFVLVLALVFVLGYSAGIKNDQIMSYIGPSVGLKIQTGSLDMSTVQQTFRALKANYDGKLSDTDLINGANRGMTAAAGDDYTVYMDKKSADEFNKDLNGDIGGGIGAEIGARDGGPAIVRVLADTPALQAGLQAEDAIVAVNDESTSKWSVSDTVSKIRGEIGTTVKITVVREGDVKEFTITRAKITAPSTEYKIQDGIGILTLTRFDDTTSEQARQAALEFKKANVRGVVLDLRGNGGGLLTSAQDIAGLWLNDKVVVSERTNGKTTDELKSGADATLAGTPTVVLINGSSASASEIVAGALKDYKVATLVGEKSFGKGSVQKLVPLANGAVLKVTVARWYTPKGKNINKQGIEPTIKVKLTAEDFKANKDPQMDEALRILNKKVD